MAKGYKRYYWRGNRDKYSVESRGATLTTLGTGSGNALVVAQSNIQGMRKVKHLTISATTAAQVAFYWALVYVPGGTDPGELSPGGNSMYEPNQFVMNMGIVDPSAGPIRIHSPVSRNLNSGDAIYLVIQTTDGTNASLFFTVRYAITLQ